MVNPGPADNPAGFSAPGWLEVARVYLKIGTVGFGGGYAVLTLIHDELVTKHGWLTEERYTNMLSLAELAPGALTVNLLAVIAYRLSGVRTMVLATAALILPSFILILVLAGALMAWQGEPLVIGALEGLTAGVIGLMLGVAWELAEKFPHRWYYYSLGIAALAASYFLGVHPIWLILAGALAGGGKAFLFSRHTDATKKPEGEGK